MASDAGMETRFVPATKTVPMEKVLGFVENPAVDGAPSPLVVTGRCLLDLGTFNALRWIAAGAGEVKRPGFSSYLC